MRITSHRCGRINAAENASGLPAARSAHAGGTAAMYAHGMMIRSILVATAIAVGTLTPAVAGSTTDTLTGLPLHPHAGSPLDPGTATVCGKRVRSAFYTFLYTGGTDAAAVAWFASHLHGYTHLHSIEFDRPQDMFAKPDGTLAVGVTGDPKDKGLYSIVYQRMTPGLTPTQMASYSQMKVVCK